MKIPDNSIYFQMNLKMWITSIEFYINIAHRGFYRMQEQIVNGVTTDSFPPMY